MHKHNNCEHELEYCKVCDVVYCEECKQQWKKPVTYQPYTWVSYNNETKPFVNLCGHDRTADNAENLTASESGNITLTTEPVECCPSV